MQLKGKKRFVWCLEKVLWLNMLKVVCKGSWYYSRFGQIILCCGAVLCTGRCLAAPLVSTHWKPIAGDSQHTQNIQIKKVIGESGKCVFYFMEKINGLFGQPNKTVYEGLVLILWMFGRIRLWSYLILGFSLWVEF